MKYSGYVAEIETDADVFSLDFEDTDYCDASAVIVSPDRIRVEWMEGDEFWAVTVDHTFENADGEFGTGIFECSYPSWEGRRNIEKHESGRVTATIIADDDEHEYFGLDQFWVDVKWSTGVESGRLMFELARNDSEDV